MDPSVSRIYAPFYSSAFAWNYALGMTQLLIRSTRGSWATRCRHRQPDRAAHHRADGLQSHRRGVDRPHRRHEHLPDRVRGHRRGRIMFAASSSFAGLFAAQIMMIVARAVYWPASWTLVSQLPGERGSLMGTLNAITSFGQIAGTVSAGMIIAGWGFGAGFGPLLRWGRLFCLGLAFRYAPRSGEGPAPGACGLPDAARPALDLLRHHVRLHLGAAVLLSVSFYPILLIEQGFGSEAAGWLVGMRALGAIAAGVVLARFVKHADDSSVPLVSACPSQLGGPGRTLHEPGDHRFFPLRRGTRLGCDDDLLPDLVSTLSSGETRGSAMALAGWGGASRTFRPSVMGALKDLYGIQAAFYALGAFAFLFSFAFLRSIAGRSPRESRVERERRRRAFPASEVR